MDETSSLMGQDEQDEQHLVGDRRHDKEIQGDEVFGRGCSGMPSTSVREQLLGGRHHTRYFSTVDLVTSMPTFRSSPTIRGAVLVIITFTLVRN